MNLQQFVTPFVLASLLFAQGYQGAYAQEPAQQPAAQPAAQPAQQPAQQGLNNDAVIRLVKAGLSDDLIVSTIGNSPGVYDISADGMIALKSGGVSDKVVSAIVLKTTAAAQPAPAPVPPLAPMPPAAPAKVLLAEGTDVMLAFDEDLTSKTAQNGDSVAFVLTEDLKVGDIVVAKTGARAVGEVVNAQKSEMMGKGGELNIRLDYLKIGSVKVHLRGTKGGEGNSGLGGAIALTMLVGVFGLLHHGKEIKVQRGTPLHAYVAEDTTLSPVI
jgi:pyruvate/2-oxoglutarate dehydrogenase complex dihydrolipoamide acyltransferase (E2) component